MPNEHVQEHPLVSLCKSMSMPFVSFAVEVAKTSLSGALFVPISRWGPCLRPTCLIRGRLSLQWREPRVVNEVMPKELTMYRSIPLLPLASLCAPCLL